MAGPSKQITGTFRVRDSNGRDYTIHEITEEAGGRSRVRYETSDGFAVHKLDRTNFEIAKRNRATGESRIEAYLIR